MRQLLPWRVAGLAVFATAFLTITAQAEQQRPAVVLCARGIESLLDDVEFLAGVFGKEDLRQTVETLLKAFIGGRDVSALNRQKPLGIYWNATAGAKLESAVVFLPISDLDALRRLLSVAVPGFKESQGAWSGKLNGTRLYAKPWNDYLYVSLDRIREQADPAHFTSGNNDLLLQIYVAELPEALKEEFLERLELEFEDYFGKLVAAANGQDETPEQRIRQLAMTVLRLMVNDADKLKIGMDIDQRRRIAAVNFAYTARPGSAVATFADTVGKLPPVGWTIGSDAALFRLLVSVPAIPAGDLLDDLAKGVRVSIESSINADNDFINDDDREAARKVSGRLLDLLLESAKSGGLHSGLSVDAGGEKTFRGVVGAKLINGNEAAACLDQLITLYRDHPGTFRIKPDVDNYRGARIHALIQNVPGESPWDLDKVPAHIAIRKDGIWGSAGKDNLSALKSALDDRPPGQTAISSASFLFKPASLIVRFQKQAADVIARARNIAELPGDKYSMELLPATNGARLKIEMGVDLLKLADP